MTIPGGTAPFSYEHAGKIEVQLQAEVAGLMVKAEAADQADLPDAFSIPDELALREKVVTQACRSPCEDRGAPKSASPSAGRV